MCGQQNMEQRQARCVLCPASSWLPRRPAKLPARKNMEVQMRHALHCVLAAVVHHTESVIESELLRELCDNREDMPHNGFVFSGYFVRARNMLFWDYQKVRGRLRVYVVKGKDPPR